jgi:DNA-directed RNA polymerase specialized sigma24 family protein
MTASDPLDVGRCERLVPAALSGDASAEQELVFRHIWPACLALARTSRFMGPLRTMEDHVLEVRAAAVERIRKRLRSYPDWQTRNQQKTFGDWICIVTANVIRDHVRDHLGDAMANAVEPSAGAGPLLTDFATSPWVSRLPARPAMMTAAQTARELLEFAKSRLPKDQFRALALWVEGAGFEEIAEDLGLPNAEDAERLKRSAVATLRREFAGQS